MDVLASETHFVDHLAAVFDRLPPASRGSFMTRQLTVASKIAAAGFAASAPVVSEDPVLVASYGDLQRARDLGRRRIAIMEHGAGQSYGGRGGLQHGSYAGGTHRDAASLFLHPGEHPAARDKRAYPGARVEIVGSPHLDTLPRREGPAGRVVAVTFHFNGPVCPETRTAYPHFFPAIAELSSRYEILGHGHPRLWDMGRPGHRLEDRYRAAGIEPVRDFAEVCRRADVLVFDNTSAGFAFAATGRPVVVMNSPRYDRRVNHGLRFEPGSGCSITPGGHFCGASHVGSQVDTPDQLVPAIERAFELRVADVVAREAALDLVYQPRHGGAALAAAALIDWAIGSQAIAA